MWRSGKVWMASHKQASLPTINWLQSKSPVGYYPILFTTSLWCHNIHDITFCLLWTTSGSNTARKMPSIFLEAYKHVIRSSIMTGLITTIVGSLFTGIMRIAPVIHPYQDTSLGLFKTSYILSLLTLSSPSHPCE
jgi:hypothetical protein